MPHPVALAGMWKSSPTAHQKEALDTVEFIESITDQSISSVVKVSINRTMSPITSTAAMNRQQPPMPSIISIILWISGTRDWGLLRACEVNWSRADGCDPLAACWRWALPDGQRRPRIDHRERSGDRWWLPSKAPA